MLHKLMSSVQSLRSPLTERKTGGRQGLDGWVGGKLWGEKEEGRDEGEMLTWRNAGFSPKGHLPCSVQKSNVL